MVVPALSEVAQHLANLIPMDVPNPGGGTAPPGSQKFIALMGWFKWIALGISVMSLIAAGVVMGRGRSRGEGGEHAERIGWVLGGVAVIAAAFSLVSFMAS